MIETEISIGFNRYTGKFNLLEKRPKDNCWWPTSKAFDTLPEAENYLDTLKKDKAIISLRDRLYRGDEVVEFMGELPHGAPLPQQIHTTWLDRFTALDTHPDGSVWYRRITEEM